MIILESNPMAESLNKKSFPGLTLAL